VNDRAVSSTVLKEIGSSLVEIHGQHDARALLDPASHRFLLDQFGGLLGEVDAVGALWRAWRDAREQAEALERQVQAASQHQDYIEAAVAELRDLAPVEGEEEVLAERRQKLLAGARMRQDLEEAAEILSGGGFPSSRLNGVLRRLERQPAIPDHVKPAMAAIERLLIEAEEARSAVDAVLRDGGENDLEQVEERLFKLRAISRKHRVPVSELPALLAKFTAELSALHHGEDGLAAARKASADAAAAYFKAAEALSAKRAEAARLLDRAVQKELKPLRLEKAKFLTHTEKMSNGGDGAAGGPHGLDTIHFQVQTNPGSKPGPMAKVASGGELARFLLALKVVLAEKNTVPLLIFDEIDTGVGGATAAAIGERLARLGERAQLLAVTHSPQVAAHADAHYRLYKTARGNGSEGMVATCAEALDSSGRKEEIARMLAGKQVTDEARAAAERLIGSKHDL
jgi:DNA repair protein RecN (Recombination protein N)